MGYETRDDLIKERDELRRLLEEAQDSSLGKQVIAKAQELVRNNSLCLEVQESLEEIGLPVKTRREVVISMTMTLVLTQHSQNELPWDASDDDVEQNIVDATHVDAYRSVYSSTNEHSTEIPVRVNDYKWDIEDVLAPPDWSFDLIK